MTQTPNVRNGLGIWNTWVDHDQPRFLRRTWTLSTSDAGVLTNLVAVILAIAAPCIFLVVQRVFERHRAKPTANHRTGNSSNETLREHGSHNHGDSLEYASSIIANTPSEGSQNSVINLTAVDEQGEVIDLTAVDEQGEGNTEGLQHTEGTPLLGSSAPRDQQDTLAKAFMRRETPQGAALEVFFIAFERDLPWPQFVFRFFVALVCFSFFAAVTIMAIYSVWIATQLSVLSASANCGEWVLDKSINQMSRFYYRQEREAAEYASRCYNAPSGADGCNFFMNQSINFEVKDRTACPFADGFCLEKDNAYTLITDLISSKDLGINVPVGYTFSRMTTCSPIQRKGYFSYDEDGLIEYNYGPHGGLTEGNLTWLSIPIRSPWDGPGYQVETICGVNATAGWHPIPEFLPKDNPMVTLMLVYSERNFHTEWRTDPIFPTDTFMFVGSEILYLNTDEVATVMACTDKATICDATGQTCWDSSDEPLSIPKEEVEKNGLYMLSMALQRSRICNSIMYRGGAALDASTKLMVYQSLPLAKEQWKVEARNLFTNSLARMQIDLRDHIRGTAATEPGFVNVLPPERQGICNQYKFKGNGWTNISVWGFLCAMTGSILAIALTYQIKNPDTDEEIKSAKLSAEVLPSLAHQGYILLLELLGKVLSLGKRVTNTLGKIKTWVKKPTETNTGANVV